MRKPTSRPVETGDDDLNHFQVSTVQKVIQNSSEVEREKNVKEKDESNIENKRELIENMSNTEAKNIEKDEGPSSGRSRLKEISVATEIRSLSSRPPAKIRRLENGMKNVETSLQVQKVLQNSGGFEKEKNLKEKNENNMEDKRNLIENNVEKESTERSRLTEEAKDNKGKVQARHKPEILTKVVSRLSEAQKRWVKDAGFGNLLEFSFKGLPDRLACNILESFDNTSCSLKLQNGSIDITEEDVAEVFGLPLGGRNIEIGERLVSSKRLDKWRSQFSKPLRVDYNITANAVCDKMAESQEVDLMFKLNFVVILLNTLIESINNTYVNQRIVSFFEDLDACAEYNWCAFVIDSLVRTKQNWLDSGKQTLFSGPLVFLTLFYVDRVECKSTTVPERRFPTYLGWTDFMLRERETEELKSSQSFGSGIIRQRLRDETRSLENGMKNAETSSQMKANEDDRDRSHNVKREDEY